MQQQRKKLSTIPITALVNELEALKKKFLRREGDPDTIVCSVPAAINQHATSIYLTGNGQDIDASQLREAGQFSVHFSFLMTRVCEMRGTSSNCGTDTLLSGLQQSQPNVSAAGNDNALGFVDPTRDPSSSHRSRHYADQGHNLFLRRVMFDSTNPLVILSPQVCHSVLCVTQQYVAALLSRESENSFAVDGTVKLQHINGALKTLLLLRSHLRYAFFNPLDLQSIDEAIVTCREMILRFIRKFKFKTAKSHRGANKSSDTPIVRSNALITSLELLCVRTPSSASNVSRDRIMSTRGNAIESLLPCKRDELILQTHKDFPPVQEILELLSEMRETQIKGSSVRSPFSQKTGTIFNEIDASSIISIFSKTGVVDKNLLDSCLKTVVDFRSEISPHSLSHIIFSCGVLGVQAENPTIVQLTRSLSNMERPDARMLRMIAMGGAMMGEFPDRSGIPKSVLTQWWKRLSCNMNSPTPFCVLVDIGHAMKVMGVDSPKGNFTIANKLRASERHVREYGPSLLESEPLTTLLKAAYMLGNTRCRRDETEWNDTIRTMTKRIVRASQRQVHENKVVQNDSVIGGYSVECYVPYPFGAQCDSIDPSVYTSQIEHVMRYCKIKASGAEPSISVEKRAPSRPSVVDTSEWADASPRTDESDQDAVATAVFDAAFSSEELSSIDDILSAASLTGSDIFSFTGDILSTTDIESELLADKPLPPLTGQPAAPSHSIQAHADEKELDEGLYLKRPKPLQDVPSTPNPHVVSLGVADAIPMTSIDPNAQFLLSTQWSVLSRSEVIEKLRAIDASALDHSSIMGLIQRIADNVDGDAALQREISIAMVPLLVSLRENCNQSQKIDTAVADATYFTAGQLSEILSIIDVLGESVVTVEECKSAVLAVLHALAVRVPDLTRTQASDLLSVTESLVPLFEDCGAVAEQSAIVEEAISRRFRNL